MIYDNINIKLLCLYKLNEEVYIQNSIANAYGRTEINLLFIDKSKFYTKNLISDMLIKFFKLIDLNINLKNIELDKSSNKFLCDTIDHTDLFVINKFLSKFSYLAIDNVILTDNILSIKSNKPMTFNNRVILNNYKKINAKFINYKLCKRMNSFTKNYRADVFFNYDNE